MSDVVKAVMVKVSDGTVVPSTFFSDNEAALAELLGTPPTIAATANLLAGDGDGNAEDSGIDPAAVSALLGAPAPPTIEATSNLLIGDGSGNATDSGIDPDALASLLDWQGEANSGNGPVQLDAYGNLPAVGGAALSGVNTFLGPSATNFTTQTGGADFPYLVQTTDSVILCDTSGLGLSVLYLPAPSAVPNQIFVIKDSGGTFGANNLQIACEGDAGGDGVNLTMSVDNGSIRIFCDGVNYWSI